MPEKDLVLDIVKVMQNADKPLILNHIAKKADVSPQLVNYHLEQMIKKGLALRIEENEKKYYMLQPIFYDENWLTALYSMLTPFVDGMNERIGFEQYDVSIPQERVVIEIFIMFLRRFQEELEDWSLEGTSKSL